MISLSRLLFSLIKQTKFILLFSALFCYYYRYIRYTSNRKLANLHLKNFKRRTSKRNSKGKKCYSFFSIHFFLRNHFLTDCIANNGTLCRIEEKQNAQQQLSSIIIKSSKGTEQGKYKIKFGNRIYNKACLFRDTGRKTEMSTIFRKQLLQDGRIKRCCLKMDALISQTKQSSYVLKKEYRSFRDRSFCTIIYIKKKIKMYVLLI